MQMFNKKLQTNFTIADNRIAQSQLSYEARGLYFYMLSLPNDWDFSEERLARAGGVGIDKIKRILKELFTIGLLKREIIKDERGYNKARYTLFDFDTIENPTLENPPLENPTLENPMYYKEIDSTKKESNKEINNNFGDFKKSQKKPKSSKEILIAYANELYDLQSKGGALHFTREQWLEWVDYKLKRQLRLTKRTLELNIKQLCDFGANAYSAITYSIGCGYQGLFLPYSTKQSQNKKPEYNPRTGNTGESVFSDNPDDYINENMAGVTKIADGVFEADLFKLTGRKA